MRPSGIQEDYGMPDEFGPLSLLLSLTKLANVISASSLSIYILVDSPIGGSVLRGSLRGSLLSTLTYKYSSC